MAGTGKSFQDRQRSANVRNLGLDLIEEVLQKGTYQGDEVSRDYQLKLLERLSSNLLPRLNEHSGEDGNDIPVNIKVTFGD